MAFLLALTVGNAVIAQQGKWSSRRLVNGFTLRYCQDTTRKLLHLGLTLRGGASLDEPGGSGLAHLYEHLFFQYLPDSTPVSSGPDQGIFVHHSTSLESHFFGLSMAPEMMQPALGMIAAGLAATEWSDSMLQDAKSAMAEELQVAAEIPENQLDDDVIAALWGKLACKKRARGEYSEILRLGSKEILQVIEAYRHPYNCLLAATGEAPPQDFFRMAEQMLGRWKPLSSGSVLPIVQFPALDSNTYFTSINEFAVRPVVMMAWPAGGAEDPAAINRDALLFCRVASLRQGKLYQRLVHGNLAYSYRWTWAGGTNPGHLLLYVLPVTDSLTRCLAAIHEELTRLDEENSFTKEGLEAAQRQFQLQAALLDDQSWPRLMAAGEEWQLSSDSVIAFPAMTRDRMREFCHQNIVNQRHVAGLLISSSLLADLGPMFDFVALSALSPSPGETAAGLDSKTFESLDSSRLRSYRVYFDRAGKNPDSSCITLLEDIAAMLLAHPQIRIFINSFTEGAGDGVINYQVSVARAKSMRAWLNETRGVPLQQMVIRAYGEAFPEFPGEKNLKNRRMTFDFAPQDAQDNAY